MKNVLLILFFTSFYLDVRSQNDCNFQTNTIDKSTKERIIETKSRVITGYAKDFPNTDMIISFQKIIKNNDTIYFIKFHFNTSTSEFEKAMYFNKDNNLSFLTKSGKVTSLRFDSVVDVKENIIHKDDPFTPVRYYYYTANFVLKITKEQLLIIGSEPFYNLILTYTDSVTKVVKTAVFIKTALFTSRTFVVKDIKCILNL